MKIDRLVSVIMILLEKERISAQELAKMFEDFIKSMEIYDPEEEQPARTVKQQEPAASSESSLPKTEPVEPFEG